MIEIFYRTIKDEKVQKLKEIKIGSWVNVVNPTQEEINSLRKHKIKKAFIEDALDPDELPRIEKEENISYVMLNVPYLTGEKITCIPLLVIITQDFFITVCKENLPWLLSLLEKGGVFTTQRTKNLLRICLQVTDLYTREIRQINKEIAAKKVGLAQLKNKDIIALVELEEGLNEFITSLVASIAIFEKILTRKYIDIFKEDEDLLEDLIIDSRQSLDMCKTSIKKIINIREAYSTILENSLNRIMKILAFLTLITGISEVIAGYYGMNVRLPMQQNPLAFFYVIMGNVIIGLALILIFYLIRWL
jgi:magnesium transporter